MRRLAAVWAGKMTGFLSRLLRRGGGTTFPGDVARAVDPGILRRLSHDLARGAVVITGTNGKTTTARLVTRVLERKTSSRVVANRAGANLIFGATAAAVAAAGFDGRLHADWAVFEVDEASLPAAVEEIRPRVVVVTNLFRDQLDRYGELESMAKTIQLALEKLPPGSKAVLNGDDPRVAEIGLGLPEPPLWYGLDDPAVGLERLPFAADAITCPRCGSRLEFKTVYVGHDGDYRCPRGDFARPQPDIAAVDIRLDGLDRVSLAIGGTRLEVGLGGLYNAYNLTAAYAVGIALGLEPAAIGTGLRDVKAAFGRQERLALDGRHLTILLAKNPAGFNAVLRDSIDLAHGRHFLVAINDGVADGRDVSWLWDVDFEILAGRAVTVIPSGVRAADMAVRLKYAEVVAAAPPEPDLDQALDGLLASVPAGESAYALCTYTAMLDLRQVLGRRGWAQAYWRT